MKQRISSFSIIIIFICLTLIGFTFIPLLPVKLSPSQALPQVNISFSMPGNSARIVEMEATSKLEAMLNRVKGVESIWSTSGNGWGNIGIRFNKYVDIDMARFEVSTVIRQTWPSLPETVLYPTISLSRTDERANQAFMTYTISAPENPILIQQFTETQIRTVISQIKGVEKVGVKGAMPMEWRLEYDAQQLEILQIGLDDIQKGIQDFLRKEFIGTASIENKEEQKKWIRIALVSESMDNKTLDVANIWIKNKTGRLISLKDLVKASLLEANPQSYYRLNGLNSIYMSITSEEKSNQLQLSNEIKEKLNELEKLFPLGYKVHLSYDATDYISKELEKIYLRIALTLLILLVFVMLIYRNIKYILLIFVSLLANISIAVIFYYAFELEMQLYSFAGITISFTLVVDNIIIMSDQIIRRNNMKAFLAILTATLTTIASLVIIFFMDEKIMLNLLDFAMVIIINLFVSLFVALFLVPALIDKLAIEKSTIKNKPLKDKPIRKSQAVSWNIASRRKRLNVYFNRSYKKVCHILWRWRIPTCVLLILAFGLPVFLLPEKMEGENEWTKLYNQTFGSLFYKENIKPYSDKILGGTLRLFVEKVYEGSYFNDREETSLHVTATLPNGSTLGQMNNLIQGMEAYISHFSELKQFQTNIESPYRANIRILFTKESERSGFPYLLKSKLISKSLELGGGSWGVYGLGDGFSNDVRESAGSYRVEMFGYNYDDLSEWAEKLKSILLEHRRIKDATINSEFSWYKDDYQEFTFDINKEMLAQEKIEARDLFSSLNTVFAKNIYAGSIVGNDGLEKIYLQSKQSKDFDIWDLQFAPQKAASINYKLSNLASIQKLETAPQIAKYNQQYRLCIQYEYIGAHAQGKKVLERTVEDFEKILPLGYSMKVQDNFWTWKKDNSKDYVLLILVFVIIFFTTSILFNSLKQPFYVLFVIPIAYIGVFLTFYLFKLNFDQGGFAAFVLLCGLTVNANIYVLNEYNNIRAKHTSIDTMNAYLKAWNAKVQPIFLTVISTILGFIPFMLGEQQEAFWFPLAAGTIGGLFASFIGTFFFLPLFMGVGRK